MELCLFFPYMPSQCRQGQLYLDQISGLSNAELQDFNCTIIHIHLVTGFPLVQHNQSVWSNRDWKSIRQTQISLNSGHKDIHLTSCSVLSTRNITARGSSNFCTSVVSNFIPRTSFSFWNNYRCLALWITHNC